MLWRKGWLETRWGFAWAIALAVFGAYAEFAHGVHSDADVEAVLSNMLAYWIFFPLILAGAGVHSRASFRIASRFHSSAYFTLGLPVSRLRLLVVRAGIGLLETMAVMLVSVIALRFILPEVRMTDLMMHCAAAAASLCGFYAVGVLFSVMIDALWRMWLAFALLYVSHRLMLNSSFPASLNFFTDLGWGSPIVTHHLPWQAMTLVLGMAAILFQISAKIAEARDY